MIFSENDRAVHARHSKLPARHFRVPKSSLDSVCCSEHPFSAYKYNEARTTPIESCFICHAFMDQRKRRVEKTILPTIGNVEEQSCMDEESSLSSSLSPSLSLSVQEERRLLRTNHYPYPPSRNREAQKLVSRSASRSAARKYRGLRKKAISPSLGRNITWPLKLAIPIVVEDPAFAAEQRQKQLCRSTELRWYTAVQRTNCHRI